MFSAKRNLKNTGITIREDLTSARAKLVKLAISSYTARAVWTADGIIFIRAGIIHKVKTREDFDFVLRTYPPSADGS